MEPPCSLRVVELPREVMETVLPLLPACTLLRARTVCRCGPEDAPAAGARRGGGEGRGAGGQWVRAASGGRGLTPTANTEGDGEQRGRGGE